VTMRLSIAGKATEDLPRLAPSTRYQGSKRRALPWLYENFRGLEFESVLDGFGGTGTVSYLFKLMGKRVTFNDLLLSNYQSGVALIENSSVKLEQSDIDFLLKENGFRYPSFIRETFKDIYYTDSENKWLDTISFNIKMLSQFYVGNRLRKKRALAYHALFQACLCKRPFNLFHRKNLYLRTASTKRSFGNKTTWDTDFPSLFLRFADELSKKVFSNGKENKVMCRDVINIHRKGFDLVYLDPPYTRPSASHPKDYYALYHFLEGIADYENWAYRIDWSTPNRRLLKRKTSWENNSLEKNFEYLFERFQDSIIVVSYGSPGNPSVSRIEQLLRRFKSNVTVAEREYVYKLNHRNGEGMYEALIIGR
jgi:adenine-specific DNA-methyltransferase